MRMSKEERKRRLDAGEWVPGTAWDVIKMFLPAIAFIVIFFVICYGIKRKDGKVVESVAVESVAVDSLYFSSTLHFTLPNAYKELFSIRCSSPNWLRTVRNTFAFSDSIYDSTVTFWIVVSDSSRVGVVYLGDTLGIEKEKE